jgi:hypothetical protein
MRVVMSMSPTHCHGARRHATTVTVVNVSMPGHPAEEWTVWHDSVANEWMAEHESGWRAACPSMAEAVETCLSDPDQSWCAEVDADTDD